MIATTTQHTRTTKTKVKRTKTYQEKFAPVDQTMPFRIVGSHEYLSAIKLLGGLVSSSSTEEIDAYDRIIKKQDEFAFFSGAKLFFQHNQNRYKRGNAIQANQQRNQKPIKRHGLVWLLALARLEVGATVAMYGGSTATFNFVAPEKFGREEYFELLLGDVADHILALSTDPLLLRKSHTSDKADSDTIAYIRRLKVVSDMLFAARGHDNGKYLAAANEYLASVQRFGNQLVENAKNAERSLAISRVFTEVGQEKSYSSQNGVESGTVTSESPIVLACQRAFLDKHGK